MHAYLLQPGFSVRDASLFHMRQEDGSTMVETHLIDVRAFYAQYVTLAGKPSRAWRTGELEYHGACPWSRRRRKARHNTSRQSDKVDGHHRDAHRSNSR